MFPRRSLRIQLRQQSSQNASTAAASSTDETSKSIKKPLKKRVRPELALEIGDATQPKQKKMKLAKHNLESFPTEILEKIFIRTNDVGLLNLANTCTRFEAIAQTVFSNRYNDQYFIINAEKLGGDRETYAAQFNRLGGYINAIQLNHIENIDSNHWAWKLIQPHLNRIKKLTFNACSFNSDYHLSQPMNNVTHLAFRNVSFRSYNTYTLFIPECRNLIELEIHQTNCFSYDSLQQTIRNNPALQRVIFNHCINIDHEHTWGRITSLIADHLNDIKELVLIDIAFENWFGSHSVPSIDKIVDLFKRLESLSIKVGDESAEFMKRLSRECKSLKHLRLFRYDNSLQHLTIRSFWQIESLYLTYYPATYTPIELPMKYLPNLRQLTIETTECSQNKFSDVLPLLHQSQSLQQITIIFDPGFSVFPDDFISAEFFEKFIETITEKSSAQIEVKGQNQVIGSVTANGVVWRNKVMRWMGCDNNDTNIRLWDLAKHRDTSEKTKSAADQPNLLDKICDYLDLASLAVLTEINEQCSQLVKNYFEKHVKSKETFIIADEFDGFDSRSIFKRFKDARLITHLDVHIIHQNYNSTHKITGMIAKFKRIDKLSVWDKRPQLNWSIDHPKVSHIVYNSSYSIGISELNNILKCFPKVEIIESKNTDLFNDLKYECEEYVIIMLSKLKTFIFNYRSKTQMGNLRHLLWAKNVKLIPIYQNLAKNSA